MSISPGKSGEGEILDSEPAKRISVLVFAQTPPPEHGQSLMVQLGLEALRKNPERFDVHHINARFSDHLEEIGEGSLRKGWRGLGYLFEALRLRSRLNQPVLYYVPGPVKWSAVVRDWILLGVLRLCYGRVVFHWHAIGQGEWAHGSPRVGLSGPRWIDGLGRCVSALVLARPWKSIAVCRTSCRDAEAVGSRSISVLPNGLEDPCPQFPPRKVASKDGLVRLLFLSHGTEAKGLMDLLESLMCVGGRLAGSGTRVELTIAGGISANLRARFDEELEKLQSVWGDFLEVREVGFATGSRKASLFMETDIFVSPSRWESFGLTVVEAMAWGVPVVASASDGVSGILGLDYPYLAEVRNPTDLADKMEAALLNLPNDGLRALGETLRQRYREDYTIARFGDSFGDVFDETSLETNFAAPPLRMMAYLADQNPKLGRSLGISRMTEVVLNSIAQRREVALGVVVSNSSVGAPPDAVQVIRVPWSTRSSLMRVITDNLHPLLVIPSRRRPYAWYFPKGFMPRFRGGCQPAVVTIHDTIIQYYQDYYPKWRMDAEYSYWAGMLRSTLTHAAAVMTVSKNAKRQVEDFIRRHNLPERKIYVTYEPCLYESLPQPEKPAKANYVLHLGSLEPHKRTAWLIELWLKGVEAGRELPKLHVVGKIPEEISEEAADSQAIVHLPFLEDRALVSQFTGAKALLFPSEVEGFGLPAIEAYYLGTPVCFVRGTSVEEVLALASSKGGFELEDPDTLWSSLDEVLAMDEDEVRECGLVLRESYGSSRVVDRMMEVFREVAGRSEV